MYFEMFSILILNFLYTKILDKSLDQSINRFLAVSIMGQRNGSTEDQYLGLMLLTFQY